MDFEQKEITDGISVVSVKSDQFKTNEISVCLATELSDNASANAVLLSLLSRKCEKYPSLLSMNRRLSNLYGASITPAVFKSGECQVLRLSATCLDDRFSIDGESISFECAKLLCQMLFHPHLENGGFSSHDVEAEKRIILQKIEAEENEKRTYVLRKAEELMFEGEPYAIGRFGSKKQVKDVNCEDVFNAWKNLLSTAKIMITVVGTANPDELSAYITEELNNISRNYKPLKKAVFVEKADKVKEYMERIDVKQGKLVLGFRVNLKSDDELTSAMRTFTDVFGGGPYSKLFANVREKMSLCYYCSARYNRQKSAIMIQCGCNEENMDKAVNEILNQLEIIKKGDFDEELASSKISLSDTLNSVNDAPDLLSAWYYMQIADDEIKSPEMSAKLNSGVTKEQVLKCASLISLDTIYKLSSPKEEK
ncbi:MAG: insulinase family protein [Eubacterium sp.]|nr:insulinase family protein [Eubacterium sp.]